MRQCVQYYCWSGVCVYNKQKQWEKSVLCRTVVEFYYYYYLEMLRRGIRFMYIRFKLAPGIVDCGLLTLDSMADGNASFIDYFFFSQATTENL